MKIIANNITLELFNGAKARDAIQSFYTQKGEICPDPMPVVEDKYGNVIELDGELNDGNTIFIKEKRKKTFPLSGLALAVLSAGCL